MTTSAAVPRRWSAAMSTATEQALRQQLTRDDGQEDLTFLLYREQYRRDPHHGAADRDRAAAARGTARARQRLVHRLLFPARRRSAPPTLAWA